MNIGFDLGLLTIWNSAPVQLPIEKNALEKSLATFAQQNLSKLAAKLYEIKTKADAEREEKPEEHQLHNFDRPEYEITLPEKTTVFPRHKKIPPPKKMTRWEKFAKEKGIVKKKRTRMIYDEASKEWAPRWGYKSAKFNAEKANVIMPEKKEGVNPFEEQRLEKKLHVDKQKMREFRNKEMARADSSAGKNGGPNKGKPLLGKRTNSKKEQVGHILHAGKNLPSPVFQSLSLLSSTFYRFDGTIRS